MRFPGLTDNGPDAGRSGLRHLDENAFVFVRDHLAASFYIEKFREHYKVKPFAGSVAQSVEQPRNFRGWFRIEKFFGYWKLKLRGSAAQSVEQPRKLSGLVPD